MTEAKALVNKQLRLPADIAQKLKEEAANKGVSQNQLAIQIFEKHLKEDVKND